MIDEKRIAELRSLMGLKIDLENFPAVELLDTLEALWKVARAAERIIYRPRLIYAQGSKKAKLKEALDSLMPPAAVP